MPKPRAREPLTEKAVAAISKYAADRKDVPYHNTMVRLVLKAERMPRAKLYALLERKGYRWAASTGSWVRTGAAQPLTRRVEENG